VNVGLVLMIAAGCGLAGMVRYGLSLAVPRDGFPWPTIVVNAAGTVVLTGALAAFSVGQLSFPAYAVLGAGVAGGLTTFSTLSVDAANLWRLSRHREMWTYLVVTIVAGLGASWATWTAATSLLNEHS
jgi:CrcB protein